ncbi:MAG: FtsX-like permease family protein [Chromatiaceae bacterium]|nr:MAG: FtsX-like permease family protein [Chromatiaceae bacterium]
MRFITLPLLNLGRRPLRSVLTAVGLTLAVAGFVALIGLTRGLERAWVDSFADRGTHLVGLKKGAVEILTASLDQHLAVDLRRVEGVRSVAGELTDLLTVADGQTVIVNGWQENSYLWQTLHLLSGHQPRLEYLNEAMLGHGLAEALNAKPGQEVTVAGSSFFVAGVFQQSSVMANGSLLVPLKTLQRIMNREGSVTFFNVLVDKPEDRQWLQELKDRLHLQFDDILFLETDDIAENNEIMRIFRAMAWGTSVVALTIALVVILNTLLMSVTERTRELGVLSALGWSPARILAVIICEGMILALLGGVAGALIGFFALQFLATVEPLRGFLQPAITLRQLAEICAATVLLGMVGGFYPAMRAVSIDPVKALRYE